MQRPLFYYVAKLLRSEDAALDRLDRPHREVLVLLPVEGLTVDEIAAVVGIPAGTVKSRVDHAKRALRALLGSRA